ncbi:SUKH-4 family immunity protein, partial [Streptomyces sp. NRRL S-646]|uniref:SUKH-4 family immunity protein n=1 Tax=Streptomyces sp. NRRL S-646 TaxID=1463917 RepID=UPI0004CB1DE7
PEFVLIPIEAPPEVPTQIAVDLGETGIPAGLIGYEYRPLSEPVYFGGLGERGLVAIATSGLFGRIAVDVATGHVVQIPKLESATANHVNSDLDSFNRCVAAVIARFPFYAEDDEERFEEVAEELRDLISGIDETALAHNGFWETFCDDVSIGDYADWDA